MYFWHKNRQTNEHNKMENPPANPRPYTKIIIEVLKSKENNCSANGKVTIMKKQ